MIQTSIIKVLMLLTIIVISVSSLSIALMPHVVWASNNEASAWTTCTLDQDCVAMNTTDCCRDDIAIHKDFMSAFRILHPLPPNCSYVECPIGTLPTRCINNMCKIINAFDQGSYK